MKEQTLILVKPDAIARNLTYKIVKIISKGFEIRTIKMFKFDKKLAQQFYSPHKGKEFFKRLCDYMITDCSIAMIVEGSNVIKKCRNRIEKNIRPKYAETVTRNSIHGSDSLESAKREIKLIFKDK